ncbi:hypothetical protein [Streptomyces paludis]|uniref:Uncharacterized protein n=1 Tax=Streptomyces paludis TaxID=2282738 RepID=A0A345HLP7_9ACTN|nr:hypothetical protein [Streptomyces paludis]AXG77621.1 hypothetical protein DVK44_07815 [Streptomyces paludis]
MTVPSQPNHPPQQPHRPPVQPPLQRPLQPPRQPPGAAADRQNSATRYLCTGVRLYEDFARTVVAETRFERIKARAPSYGVDLDEVARHAEAALRDLRLRDRWVGAAFVFSLLLAPWVTILYALISALLGSGTRRRIRVRKGESAGESAGPAHLRKPQGSQIGAIARPLITQALVLLAACWFGPLFLWSPPAFATYVMTMALLIGCPWYFTWRQRSAAWAVVRQELRPGPQVPAQGGPPAAASDAKADATGNATTGDDSTGDATTGDDANLIAYSGYTPFVGAGVRFSSWSFANRLVPEGWKPGTGERPPPVAFTTSDLVDRLGADLAELSARTPGSTDGIVGLEVGEKVFVHGSALLSTPLIPPAEIWPGGEWAAPGLKRPTDRLPRHRITAARGLIDGPLRHCLCVQIRSWDTDLVLTVFVQVALNGGTLYLQSDTRVLAPVREEYRVADSLHATESAEEGARRAAESVLAAGPVLLASVPNVLSELGAAGRLRRWEEEERWAIERDKRYDFGAHLSLREAAASPNYRNFFQFVDATRTGKQVELQVLGSVLNFLAEHGLDVSDLDARRTTILNNGVMMYGGSVNGSIAAGTGATATTNGPGGAGPAPSAAK